MAGRGPAPKAVGQRRRRNEPARGEWTELEPLKRAVLRVADRGWSQAAKAMWAGWRQDPMTGLYGPGEIVAVWELARRWDELADTEQRLRMDGLGLTLKGKRDLRVRLVDPQPEAAPVPTAVVRQLRAV